MSFCDFCTCSDCQNGKSYLSHAETEDGRWICDVCFTYESCMDKQRELYGKHNGPCENDCEHRPKLISEFVK
jgi:hypothetical protein